MTKYIALEEMRKTLKTIIGVGTIKYSGTNQSYLKGDVMVVLNSDNARLYKCKNEGNYSIPDSTNFKELVL